MIFSLQFILIFAGYGAVSSLSGNFMELYTGADDIQLGLYFMIPHFLHIARPFIGAQADRNQSHKKLYAKCALVAAISYLPYIILPFLLKNPTVATFLNESYRFWMLCFFHAIGSISLNGCRTLADALAKNYARRTKIEYVSMRKYAPVGMGLCGYLFGFLNEEWFLPDYVPAMMLFSLCMTLLSLLIYLWPEEYFVIMSSDEEELTLPTTGEILQRALGRLTQPFKKDTSYEKQLKTMTTYPTMRPSGDFDTNSEKSIQKKQQALAFVDITNKQEASKPLSVSQQLGILSLVLKRDFRISLAFLILFVGGWTCRSAQNFVFVQLEEVCETRKTCHPGKLSGDVLAGISLLEFLTYITLSFCKNFKLNRLMLLEVAILSISLHYYFFGFFVEHVSSIWFLLESLHGFEFAIFITTSLGWGYSFANEVEYIIPELKERGIVKENDDLNLVKVSLVTTMMSCMTLLYEGFGSTAGSLAYGIIIKRYGFHVAWKVNGTIAIIQLLIILLGLILNRCMRLKPKMTKLKTESLRARALTVEQQSV